MASLHIVILNDFGYVNGGASQVALRSARALARAGCSVTVFCAVGPVSPEFDGSSVNVICCNHREILKDPNRLRGAVRGIWNRAAAGRFRTLLDTLDPSNTVIHLHGWTKGLSSSVVPVALRHGFRVVATLHDYFMACPNGGFFDYRKNEICKLQPLSGACLITNCDRRNYSHKTWRSVRQVAQRFWGQIPRGIKHFIAISDFSQAILEPFLSAGSRIYHVENPIFVDRAEPVRVEQNRSYAAVGRVDPEKGVLVFASAAQRTGVDAVFVGDGEFGGKVHEVCPSATITGWLPQKQVEDQLDRSRALVFPSLWYETQGLVVLEAAAKGVPAIVPDTSAAREMVHDGKTGLLFRGGEADDLAEKIRALGNDAVVQKMGRAAYERYWAKPSTIDLHVRQLESVYNQVVSG